MICETMVIFSLKYNSQNVCVCETERHEIGKIIHDMYSFEEMV